MILLEWEEITSWPLLRDAIIDHHSIIYCVEIFGAHEKYPKMLKIFRDEGRCRCIMCGKQLSRIINRDVHIHHMVPRSKGGEEGKNLLLVCGFCHNRLDYVYTLIRRPFDKVAVVPYTVYITPMQKVWILEHDEIHASSLFRDTLYDILDKYDMLDNLSPRR